MNNWLPILMYHRVCDQPRSQDPLGLCTQPQDLDRVLRYLTVHRYRFVSLDAALRALVAGKAKGQRLACLTFDDGYRDFYTTAFPILQKHGASATVFLVVDRLGDTNRWDDGYGLPPVPLMDQRQVRELDAAGIELGSHTLSHPRLTQLGAPEQAREIIDSRKALEAMLGHSVSYFCYPHMDSDDAVQTLARRAGYRAAFGGEQATNEPFLLHRINVSQARWPSALLRIWGWRFALQRNAPLRQLKHVLTPARPPDKIVEVGR
ncbi:MAG: polysaccharide deacetylase family protein [Dehalococcoidia bacterium]